MSIIRSSAENLFGTLASIKTLLEQYPVLGKDELDKWIKNALTYMMKIMKILGMTEEELLNWFCTMLSGLSYKAASGLSEAVNKGNGAEVSQGILDVIEEAVKVALIANLKGLWTCSINPILDNELMDHYTLNGQKRSGEGIEINLDNIDVNNILRHSPSSTNFFDTNYSQNEVWKSRDFNAYLWYVINKESGCSWDNRFYFNEQFNDATNGETFKNAFFNADGTGETISFEVNGNKYDTKKKILTCKYSEHSLVNGATASNVLSIWLNGDRYTKGILNGKVNKTIFTFNYDYVRSLKLFESKSLLTNIINNVLGIVSTVSPPTIQKQYIEEEIRNIVEKSMENDDTINDCYFSFSNTNYETMLNKTTKTLYESGLTEEEVDEKVSEIDDNATLVERQTQMLSVLKDISATYESREEESYEISWGFDFFYKLFNESIVQIIMQILSPKVVILFALNEYIMGEAKCNISIETLMNQMTNLIIEVIKEVKDLILKYLYDYLLSQIKPIIELFISKILLETIRNFKELLENLQNLYEQFFKIQKQTTIDDVNYADIVPQITESETIC